MTGPKAEPREAVEVPGFGTPNYRRYFRTEYVERDPGGLLLGIRNGRAYTAFLFTLIAAAFGASAAGVREYRALFPLTLPLYLLAANALEYLLHRFPMHHRTPGLAFFYKHVTIHHSFFTEKQLYLEAPRDVMAVFLPALYFVAISVALVGIASVIGGLAGRDHAFFFLAVSYAYYGVYEFLHFAHHTSEDGFLKKLPFLRRLAAFHLRHHDVRRMNRYNFNITVPLFDYLLGTVDREPRP